jgi:putative DNA primase/helicase
MITTFACDCIEHQYDLELTASGIADDIANLNFRAWNPLDENELDEVFTLLIPDPEHLNNGTLAGYAQKDLANTLRSGGWFFAGYKGICVKPNNPRIVEGKTIKYESPRGAGNLQLLIPRVSWGTGRKIADRGGAVLEAEYLARMDANASPSDEDCYFWDWFLSTDLSIVITEGAKKACSLVSAGYPAIALNGIWGWGTNVKDVYGNVEKDGLGKSLKLIHPDLEPFLDDREIVLAFDRDDNPATVRKVDAAKNKFRAEIGDRASGVTQLKWNNYKGIDDLIGAKGVKALDKAYAKRTELAPIIVKTSHFISSVEDGLVKVTNTPANTSSEYIGNHLAAIAIVDNPEGDGLALLLEFATFKGAVRRWTMLRADLAGDGNAIIAGLLARGYSFKREHKGLILDYLLGLGKYVEDTYTVTESSGWVGNSFVLPHQTYGDEQLKFRNVEPAPDAMTELKGTLEGWKDTVAAKCAGNSRLLLGLGTSFAAPLLPIVDLESGGFHLVGTTSQGKTTILSVAASVTGVKDIPHWRTTTNGLESTATAFNHLCLPLDEIHQADAKDVGNIAYMLANGQGKTRMKKDLTNRKGKTWRLLVLSSGEASLGKYMQEAGITQKGGQEVRLPDIPAAPVGAKYGCFETIHELEADRSASAVELGGRFATALEAAVKEHHGTALDAFLARLVVDTQDPSFAGNLAQQVHLVAANLAAGTRDSAIGRVAKRFALVQVALGLAHQYGLLPFAIEQIEWAIAECFKAWLTGRGGDGSIEVKQACDRIQHLLISNEFSDRVMDLRDGDTKTIRNLLGIRKVDESGATDEIWVPSPIFDKEFVGGVNKAELVKELQQRGWLEKPGLDGLPTGRRVLNGKRSRFFCFQISAIYENRENVTVPTVPTVPMAETVTPD